MHLSTVDPASLSTTADPSCPLPVRVVTIDLANGTLYPVPFSPMLPPSDLSAVQAACLPSRWHVAPVSFAASARAYARQRARVPMPMGLAFRTFARLTVSEAMDTASTAIDQRRESGI